MRKKSRLVLGFITSNSMTSRARGRAFFELTASLMPALLPQRYDVSEPVKRNFSLTRLDEMLASWGNGFLWRRDKPPTLGSYWAGTSHGIDDAIYIEVLGKSIDTTALVTYLAALVDAFSPRLAYIHSIHSRELSDLEYYRNCVMPFGQGLSTHDLKGGIPGLCWATYLGPEYVNLIGPERLLSTPAHEVREIASGFYIQLTNSVWSGETDYDTFCLVRNAAIQHLDRGVFSSACERLMRIADAPSPAASRTS